MGDRCSTCRNTTSNSLDISVQERVSKVSAYQTFIDSEGTPNITSFAVDDVRAVEVEPDGGTVPAGQIRQSLVGEQVQAHRRYACNT